MAAELTVMPLSEQKSVLRTVLSGFFKKKKKNNPLMKSDLRRKGGKKSKENGVCEHMYSRTTPGNA